MSSPKNIAESGPEEDVSLVYHFAFAIGDGLRVFVYPTL